MRGQSSHPRGVLLDWRPWPTATWSNRQRVRPGTTPSLGESRPVGDAHAVFMDALVEEEVVVLGGPIGEGDGENSLLVVDADGEAAIRARLAEDPWADDLLTIESVRPWSVWLRAK